MNKKRTISLIVILVVLMLVLIGVSRILAQQQGPALSPSASSPSTPQSGSPSSTPQGTGTAAAPTAVVTETSLPGSPALPPADEAAQRLIVPKGFEIRIFADNLRGTPRFMTVGPDGQIYVSLYGSGEIARLPDLNKDGLADRVEIVATGLSSPHGLEWHDGWLYVAELGRVVRLQDQNGDGTLETSRLVTDNIPGGGGHSTRTLHFGPDGYLYVSAGSSCNVCEESDPRRAAILRFNPDGSIPADNPFANDSDPRKQAVWAWGLRNSVDFLWTTTGALWADHNGRDNLRDSTGSVDNLPPEEIIIPVQKGMSHGWPYCYTATTGVNLPTKPEVLDDQSGLQLPAGFDCSLANVVPALFTDLAHSAPLGMVMATDQLGFPRMYQRGLFVAYHGSWNTSDSGIRDCKVVRIKLNGEIPSGVEDFVTGWRAPGQTCGAGATWGRPADVVIGADGGLYISDDKGDRVYRVVYTGK